jgi:hypothetical protein
MNQPTTEPPDLPELRTRAHIKGYAIEYGGFYCKTATVYPWHKDRKGAESFDVDMGNCLAGLRQLEQVIADLPTIERTE